MRPGPVAMAPVVFVAEAAIQGATAPPMRLFVTFRGCAVEGPCRRVVMVPSDVATVKQFAVWLVREETLAVHEQRTKTPWLATKGFALLPEDPVREVLRDGESVEACFWEPAGLPRADAIGPDPLDISDPVVAGGAVPTTLPVDMAVPAALGVDAMATATLPSRRSAAAAAAAETASLAALVAVELAKPATTSSVKDADGTVSSGTPEPANANPRSAKRRRTGVGFVTDALRATLFGGAGSAGAGAQGSDGTGDAAKTSEPPLIGPPEGPPARGSRKEDESLMPPPPPPLKRKRSMDANPFEYGKSAQTASAEDEDFYGPLERSRQEVGLRLVGETVTSEVACLWTYPLMDERRRCFAGFLPNAVDSSSALRFFEAARSNVKWRRPDGPHGPIPRMTAWMTSNPCSCTYFYSGVKVNPEPFSHWVLEAMQICMPLCGLDDPAKWPNSCNLNLYEDGEDSVAWHADDERLFNGKFEDCLIISLSLGASRCFELKAQEGPRQTRRLELGNGDLCTMEGLTQKHYSHRVPKDRQSGCVRPRVNLTWRWVKTHTKNCTLWNGSADEEPEQTAKRLRRNGAPPKVAAARERQQRQKQPVKDTLYEVPGRRPVGGKLPEEEVESSIGLDEQKRSKWVSVLLKRQAAGQVSADAVFNVLKDPRLIADVSEKVGRRMYRSAHGRFESFTGEQRKVLEFECELGKKYAKNAWDEVPISGQWQSQPSPACDVDATARKRPLAATVSPVARAPTRQAVVAVVHKFDPVDLTAGESERVLSKKSASRMSWLQAVLRQAADGRVSPESIYAVVANPRFAASLKDSHGCRMYNMLVEYAMLFQAEQQQFLKVDCALAKSFAAKAAEATSEGETASNEAPLVTTSPAPQVLPAVVSPADAPVVNAGDTPEAAAAATAATDEAPPVKISPAPEVASGVEDPTVSPAEGSADVPEASQHAAPAHAAAAAPLAVAAAAITAGTAATDEAPPVTISPAPEVASGVEAQTVSPVEGSAVVPEDYAVPAALPSEAERAAESVAATTVAADSETIAESV